MGNKLWLEHRFSEDYLERNPLSDEAVSSRCIYFTNILNLLKEDGSGEDFPPTILEVGAGQGQNMLALEKISNAADLKLKLFATEPCDKARELLSKNVNTLTILPDHGMLPKLDLPSHSKELVFTSGVLIHVPTSELIPSMRELYRVSSRYILAMEYFSPVERKVSYHGNDDALWLRDYGSIYLDNFKLKLLGFGFCWKRITKLDNITWWLFEKVN